MEALVAAKKGSAEFADFVVDFQLLLADVYAARDEPALARGLLQSLRVGHPGDQRIRDALGRLADLKR